MIKRLITIPLVIMFLYMVHWGITILFTKTPSTVNEYEVVIALTFGLCGIFIIVGVLICALIILCMFLYWYVLLRDEISWLDYLRTQYNIWKYFLSLIFVINCYTLYHGYMVRNIPMEDMTLLQATQYVTSINLLIWYSVIILFGAYWLIFKKKIFSFLKGWTVPFHIDFWGNMDSKIFFAIVLIHLILNTISCYSQYYGLYNMNFLTNIILLRTLVDTIITLIVCYVIDKLVKNLHAMSEKNHAL